MTIAVAVLSMTAGLSNNFGTWHKFIVAQGYEIGSSQHKWYVRVEKANLFQSNHGLSVSATSGLQLR